MACPPSTFETGTPAVEMRRALERADVVSLPAFRPLGHVKLHCLALLQALETARLDRREVHKNVFATLTADEAVPFGVIKPLYCSLFCHVVTVFLSINLRWKGFGVLRAGMLVGKKLLTNRF